ncbi:MAG: hypothetical protein WC516_05125 [Patescibacteria group bacterium]|jgi:hypothetical protein
MIAKEANEIVYNIDTDLSSDDERFNYSVKLVHVHEGSFQFYDNAFAMKAQDLWFIFTEHHKYFIYHEDDVRVSMYKRVDVYNFDMKNTISSDG